MIVACYWNAWRVLFLLVSQLVLSCFIHYNRGNSWFWTASQCWVGGLSVSLSYLIFREGHWDNKCWIDLIKRDLGEFVCCFNLVGWLHFVRVNTSNKMRAKKLAFCTCIYEQKETNLGNINRTIFVLEITHAKKNETVSFQILNQLIKTVSVVE